MQPPAAGRGASPPTYLPTPKVAPRTQRVAPVSRSRSVLTSATCAESWCIWVVCFFSSLSSIRAEHRIAHRLDLAIGAIDHQLGGNLRHFLRHQAVLEHVRRVVIVT